MFGWLMGRASQRDEVLTSLAKAFTKLARLTEITMSDLSTKIDTLTASAQAMEGKLDAIRTSNVDLKAQVDALTAANAKLQASAASDDVKADVASAVERITALTAEIDSHTADPAPASSTPAGADASVSAGTDASAGTSAAGGASTNTDGVAGA